VIFLASGAMAAPSAVTKKEWTFMVFMAADNNLESSAEDDMNEMETIGSTDRVNIVVQLDRFGKNVFNNETNWSGAKRFFIQKDNKPKKVTSPVVDELEELDMAAPKTLIDFVRWTKNKYPAKRYALIFWNHGTGWKEVSPDYFGSILPAPGAAAAPVSAGDVPEGINYNISYDDTSGTSMDIPTLGSTVRQASQILGRKIDLIGFDACLMQMAEVSYEMAPYALYQVACPDREPDRGWPYDSIMKQLADHPTIDGKQLGEKIVSAYRSSYTMGSQGNTAVILSLIDLGRMATFIAKLRVLTKAIQNGIVEIDKIEKARIAATQYVYDDYRDLASFLKKLIGLNPSAAIKTAAQDMLSLLNTKGTGQLVIANGAAGEQFKDCGGMAVFFPDRSGFRTYQKRYGLLRFSKVPGTWFDLLGEIASPNLSYLSIQEVILEDNNKDGKIAPGERVKVKLVVRNNGKLKAPAVNVECRALNQKVVWKTAKITATTVPAPGKEAVIEGLEFEVNKDVEVNSEVQLQFSLSGEAIPVSTHRTTFFVKSGFVTSGHVLLVFADAFSPAAPVLQNMFAENRMKFDLWDRMLDGNLKPEVLKRYLDGWVLLSVQDSSDQQVLLPQEIDALSGYLKLGGKLVLTGQDLAFSLRDTDFLKTLCKVGFIQDDTNVLVLTGQNGFLRNQTTQIFGGDGANNQKWPDEIDARTGAKLAMKYDAGSRDMISDKDLTGPDFKPGARTRGIKSSGGAAVTVVDGYRLMFFGFGIESVSIAQLRQELFQEIVKFMTPGVNAQIQDYAHAATRRSNARTRGQRTDREILEDVDMLRTLQRRIVRDVGATVSERPEFAEELQETLETMPSVHSGAIGVLKKDLGSLLEFNRQHGTLK
jgi:hypothetical protein